MSFENNDSCYVVTEYLEKSTDDHWIHRTVLGIGALVISLIMLGLPLAVAATLMYLGPNEITIAIMGVIMVVDVSILATLIYSRAIRDNFDI